VTAKDGTRVRWDRGVAGNAMNRHLAMVASWSELGFVIFDKGTGKFVEDERTLGIEIA